MANYFHGGHLASATMPTDQQLLNRRRRSARRLPIGIDALQAEPTRRGCGSEGSTDQRVTSSVPREDLDERKVSRLRILDANGTDTDLWCEGLRLPSCPRGRMPVRATIEDPVVIQRILRHLGLSVEAGEPLPTTRGSYSRTAASVSLPAASAKGNSRPTAKRPGPPNAPKSFCAPCAMKMTPTMARATRSAQSTAERSRIVASDAITLSLLDGENHSKARLAGHHLRVGLGGLLERHGLDHGGDSAEDAEFQRRVSGRWCAGERALDPSAAEQQIRG